MRAKGSVLERGPDRVLFPGGALVVCEFDPTVVDSGFGYTVAGLAENETHKRTDHLDRGVATSTRLPRIDPSLRTAALVAGDALAIGAFVYAGEVRHGFPPPSYPWRFAGTLAPFLLAWVTLAVIAGLYTTDAAATLRHVLYRTVPAWLVAILLAHGLRATPLFHGGTTPAFVAVSAVGGGVLVVGWRSLVVVLDWVG